MEYSADLSISPPSSNPKLEADMMARYPPLIGNQEFIRLQGRNLPLVLAPAIVMDVKGRVLFWHLPKAFTESRQVSMTVAF